MLANVRRACAVAILMALAMTAGATHASVVGLSPQEITALERGDVVVRVSADPQGAAGLVEAAIDIAVPPQTLFALMLDCTKAAKFVDGLEKCDVKERDPAGAWDIREHVVSWGLLLPSVRNVFRSDYVVPMSIRFKRVEGDMSEMEGEWTLTAMSGGTATRLTYWARLGLDFPVPNSFVRAGIEADVPETLRALRAEALTLPK